MIAEATSFASRWLYGFGGSGVTAVPVTLDEQSLYGRVIAGALDQFTILVAQIAVLVPHLVNLRLGSVICAYKRSRL